MDTPIEIEMGIMAPQNGRHGTTVMRSIAFWVWGHRSKISNAHGDGNVMSTLSMCALHNYPYWWLVGNNGIAESCLCNILLPLRKYP